MYITLMEVHGLDAALFGLGLSHGLTSGMTFTEFQTMPRNAPLRARLLRRAEKLAGLGGGHDKFLRAIQATLHVRAPLFWWKQFDTYKVGTVTQSESTMHNLLKTPITAEMFADYIPPDWLALLEETREAGDFDRLNRWLPQSFLQSRVAVTNYATLGNMLRQRQGHKLKEWRKFCDFLLDCLPYQELLSPQRG